MGGGFAFRVCRLLPSRCDEGIFRAGRDGSAWEAPLGDFLSKRLIHKMPPLRSPEATGHCQVLPHPWGVAFKSGGGAQAMQRGQEPHMFCSETLCMMDSLGLSESHGQL